MATSSTRRSAPTAPTRRAGEHGGVLIRLMLFVVFGGFLVSSGLGALTHAGRGVDFNMLTPETPAIVTDPQAVPVASGGTTPRPSPTPASTPVATSTSTGTVPATGPAPGTEPVEPPAPSPTAPPEPPPASTPPPSEPPSSPPPASPPPAPSSSLTGEILAATNADRASAGLAPLRWDAALADAAQSWSGHMAAAGTLSHQDLNALWPVAGSLTTLGENILTGPGTMTAPEMEVAWMGSTGHRANILRPEFTVAGIGVTVAPDGHVWVSVVFGG